MIPNSRVESISLNPVILNLRERQPRTTVAPPLLTNSRTWEDLLASASACSPGQTRDGHRHQEAPRAYVRSSHGGSRRICWWRRLGQQLADFSLRLSRRSSRIVATATSSRIKRNRKLIKEPVK